MTKELLIKEGYTPMVGNYWYKQINYGTHVVMEKNNGTTK